MRKTVFVILFCLPLGAFAQKNPLRFIENIEINVDASEWVRVAGPEKKAPLKKNQPRKEPEQNPAVMERMDNIENYSPLQFKYALIMDRDVETISHEKLYTFIDEWWKTPYRMGGNAKTGIDCSAFARALMQEVFDISLPRNSKAQYEESVRISKSELQEGDLVFFNTNGAFVSHVGVYLGDGYFVHASSSAGVIISNLSEEYYSRHFTAVGRPSPGSGEQVLNENFKE